MQTFSFSGTFIYLHSKRTFFKKETNKKQMKNKKQMIGQPVTFFGKKS